MDNEALIWGYIPTSISFLEIILSFIITFKKTSLFNVITTGLITILNGLSIYILVLILLGNWPTYLPHLLVLASTLLIVLQLIKNFFFYQNKHKGALLLRVK